MKNTLKAVVAVAGVLVASLGFAGVLVINVPAGETQDFYTAVEANGYTREAFKDHPVLTKTGTGTLISTNDLASEASGYYFKLLRVNEGVFVARCKADLGVNPMAPGAIDVLNGATLRFEGASGTEMLNNWCVDLKGTGASGEGGAIRCVGPTGVSFAQYRLQGDATFATSYADGYTMCFMAGSYTAPGAVSKINLNGGYNATLKAVGSGKGFCLSGSGFRLDDTGQLIVDGTEFVQDNESLANKTVTDGTTTLVLKNGATFGPKTQVMVSFFDNIDISSDSVIRGRGTSAFDMTIGGWAGAGTIDGGISSLTIADSLTVRTDDLIAGKRLELPGPITFGEGVTLKIEGSFSSLNPGQDGRVKFVASEDGIMGCPTLVTQLGRHWTFEKAADGKSLDLVYDSMTPAGAIDVRTAWGVRTGKGEAAGNAARFNDALAMCEAEKPLLYFPEGDYWFDAPLVISKPGVTVLGDYPRAVLHAAKDGTASSLVTVTGIANVTLTGLHFADTESPAVSATSANGIAVSNNYFTAVGGTVDGTANVAPVAVADSTGVMVRDNQVMDGTVYTAPSVSLSNCTTAEGSEPVVGKVRLWVDQGETLDLMTALARTGRGDVWSADCSLQKAGPGTLVGTNTLSSLMIGTEILEGTFSARVNYDFGKITFADKGGKYKNTDEIFIRRGGTLLLAGDSSCINNRRVYVEGEGTPGAGGAVVVRSKNGHCAYAQYWLTDDAVFSTEYAAGYARCLDRLDAAHPASVHFSGHRLTLRAANGGKGFQLDTTLRLFAGGGTLAVDGCALGQSANAFTVTSETGAIPLALELKNGATLCPRTQDIVGLFGAIACDATSKVMAESGAAAFDVSVPAWSGCGSVDASIASLTVTRSLTVNVDDLKAGRCLSVAGPLSLGADSKLTLTGDAGALVPPAEGNLKVATSGVSLTGVPRWTPSLDFRHWSAVAGEDGKSIELAYSDLKPDGVIDMVADWGIVPGAGATGNAALFNAKLAACEATNPVLYFPAGDYYFEAPLEIAKPDVTVLGDYPKAVLHGAITVSDAANVTLTELHFADTEGPAVSATSANGIAVSNNYFTAVGGTVDGTANVAPVAVADSAGVMVRDNQVMDGTVYTAPSVSLSNCTTAEGSEPVTGKMRIWVDQGEVLDCMTAIARTGRATWQADCSLQKAGPGTLVGTNTLTSLMIGTELLQGVYSVRVNDDFGMATATGMKGAYGNTDMIYLRKGATLVLTGNSRCIANRVIFIEGEGAPGEGGAIVIRGNNGHCAYAQFTLTDDAVISTEYADDYAQCFYRWLDGVIPSRIRFAGHRLTLKAANGGKGFRLDAALTVGPNGGTLTVDGCALGQSTAQFAPKFESGAVPIVLDLKNGAEFRPRAQGLADMFGVIACDAASKVLAESDVAAFGLTVGGWSGAGTVGTGISSLAVTNSFEVNAADILAGDHMTAACPVTLSAGIRMRVSDPDGLFAAMERKSVRYVCAESAVSFAGLPRKDGTSDFKSWKPVLVDGTTLCIDTYLGALLLIR